MGESYQPESTRREQVEGQPGGVVLQFGTNWCGWCRSAEPVIERVLSTRPDITRLKIEDGPGRPLGRSFRIKLWPTLVFLKDGQEVARVVRPRDDDVVIAALALL